MEREIEMDEGWIEVAKAQRQHVGGHWFKTYELKNKYIKWKVLTDTKINVITQCQKFVLPCA